MSRRFVTGRFVAQRQHVTLGQSVSLRRVLDFVHATAGIDQPERASKFAFFQECPPYPLDLRLESGLRKVVELAADNSASWEPEQPRRSVARILIGAVVVRAMRMGSAGWKTIARNSSSSCLKPAS